MRSYARLGLLLLFVVALALIARASGVTERFELDYLRREFLERPLRGTLIFVLLFCLGGLLRIPGLVFLFAAVLALGQVLGGAVTYIAAVVSCTLSFLVIRAIGGDVLRQLRWPWVQRLLQRLDQRPLASIVILRTFLMVAPPLNYALAMSGVRLRHYVLGTLLGLPLPIAVCSLFAELLMRLLDLPAR